MKDRYPWTLGEAVRTFLLVLVGAFAVYVIVDAFFEVVSIRDSSNP